MIGDEPCKRLMFYISMTDKKRPVKPYQGHADEKISSEVAGRGSPVRKTPIDNCIDNRNIIDL